MAEPRHPEAALTDEVLERALRGVAASIAFPGQGQAGADIAAAVRVRIASRPAPAARRWPPFLRGTRPLRRSLVLALAALLVLAAVAGAIGLGLPGIRIIVGDPASLSPAPPATASPITPLGSSLGLGMSLPFEEVERLAEFDLILPPDPAVGAPDASFLYQGRVALVWAARPALPGGADGIGLLITEFRGFVDDGYYEKIVDGGARPEPVTVDGRRGYWIAGPPHYFVYIDEHGDPVEDSHRLVGDTLIWTDGEITFRLESSLGRDAAIELAESLE